MTTNTPCLGTYQIDPERSVIAFRTRHLFGLGPVRGTFRLRAGEIRVAERVQASAVRATVDAASSATGNPARDRIVKSARLLDTGQHPVFTFASSQLTQDGDRWTLRGSLVVGGSRLPVELAIERQTRTALSCPCSPPSASTAMRSGSRP